MSCLCREGEKKCVWWITREFDNTLKSYCSHPNVVIQTKIMCDGAQGRYDIKRETLYQNAHKISKLAQ